MIAIQLMGGMGNQMFQYAIGKSLAKKYNTELYLDTDWLLDHSLPRKMQGIVLRNFDLKTLSINNYTTLQTSIHIKRLSPILEFMPGYSKYYDQRVKKKLGLQVVREEGYQFNETLFNTIGNDSYLIGYRQSYKYFENVNDDLKKEFSIIIPNTEQKIVELKKNIENTNSICLNVRRGDYLTDPLFYTQTIDYYHNGVNYICNKLGVSMNNINIFIFSDDIARCIDNLQLWPNTFIVDKSYAGPNYTWYQELLSLGKHFVGANSTFCRWAIRKNWTNKKVIVLPSKRYKNKLMTINDLVPEYRNVTYI